METTIEKEHYIEDRDKWLARAVRLEQELERVKKERDEAQAVLDLGTHAVMSGYRTVEDVVNNVEWPIAVVFLKLIGLGIAIGGVLGWLIGRAF